MKNEVSKEFILNKKGKYLVSNKLFLDLIFNNNCNCNCKFCIAKTKTFAEENLEEWKKSLKKTIKIFKEDIDSIIILGGEATVDPNFFKKLDYIHEVTKDNHIFTILTTNGCLLRNDSFLEKVAKSTIDSINISVMNYDLEYNKYLMRGNVLTREELKKIHNILHKHGKTLRFNTNVAKNNLASLEEIEKYIDYYNGCCDVIKFTPLMKTDMFNTIEDILIYTHKNSMTKEEINGLFDELVQKYGKNITNDKVFGLINYDDLDVKGQHIILKYEQVEDMYDLDKVIPTLKLYQNGNLSNEWNYSKNILTEFV